MSFRPFRAISYVRGRTEDLWAPARQDEAAIAFSFMLCLSVGLAVLSLGGFHAYLVLTAQTTIEFHGTCLGDKNLFFQDKRGHKRPIITLRLLTLSVIRV